MQKYHFVASNTMKEDEWNAFWPYEITFFQHIRTSSHFFLQFLRWTLHQFLRNNFEYLDELETQIFLLLSVGFEPVTCMRGGQLDQTSTEVYKNITAFSIIRGTRTPTNTCSFPNDEETVTECMKGAEPACITLFLPHSLLPMGLFTLRIFTIKCRDE